MTTKSELNSWLFGGSVDTKDVPEIDGQAPDTPQLKFPRQDGKPVVVTFLRHCGCPFAEKTFNKMRDLAKANKDVHFVAVSHSDQSATDNWLKNVGGAGDVQVIVDHERKIYGAYGLGVSSFWHVLNPGSLKAAFSGEFQVRPTESGTRWQTAGSFAMDSKGKVKFAHKSESAEDISNLNEAIKAVGSPQIQARL